MPPPASRHWPCAIKPGKIGSVQEARADRRREPGRVASPCIAAATVLAIAGCSHTPQPTTIVVGPKRELLIPAVINDIPLVLQLDTGASHTSLAPATCRHLFSRLPRFDALSRRRRASPPPPRGSGAGGDIADVTWVMLHKLQVAGEVFRGHAAVVVDIDTAGGAIGGMLGMDVLGEYVVEVDLRAHRFVLHSKLDASLLSPELVAADYQPLAGGQIALAITIEGRAATAILDLGANRTFANTRAGLTPDDRETTISAAIGADRNRLVFRSASDVPLGYGELVLRVRSVWISDLPIFRTFGIADRAALILGTDVLAGRRIVIDPFARRVYLSR